MRVRREGHKSAVKSRRRVRVFAVSCYAHSAVFAGRVPDKRARASWRFCRETMVGSDGSRDCARAGGAADLHAAANRDAATPPPPAS